MTRRQPIAGVGLGFLFTGLAFVFAVYFAVMFGACAAQVKPASRLRRKTQAAHAFRVHSPRPRVTPPRLWLATKSAPGKVFSFVAD